jgi:hypothetical protein
MATDRVKWRRKGCGRNRGVKPKHTHTSPESGIEDNVVAFVSKYA